MAGLEQEWTVYKTQVPKERISMLLTPAQGFAEIIYCVLQNIVSFETMAQDKLPGDSERLFGGEMLQHFEYKWALPINPERLGRKCFLYGNISLDATRTRQAGFYFGGSAQDFLLTRNFVFYVENNLPDLQKECQVLVVEQKSCICQQFLFYLTKEKIADILISAKRSVVWLCPLAFDEPD